MRHRNSVVWSPSRIQAHAREWNVQGVDHGAETASTCVVITGRDRWWRHGRWIVPAGIAVYAALIMVAVSSQEILLGDGAFFSFTATLSDPWAANWRDYPGRFIVFLTTVVPTHLLYRAGLPFHAVPDVYAFLFLIHPMVGMVCAYALLPRAERDWLLLPLAFWAGIGMCTFGFPMEAFVTASAFWPLLFGALYPPRSIWHTAMLLGATLVFCFSHEAALLAVPAILLAILWNGQRFVWPARLPRCGLLLLMTVGIAALGALYFAALFRPANPQVAHALGENRLQAFDPMIFRRFPMLRAGSIILALSVASLFINVSRHRRSILVLVFLATAVVVTKTLVSHELAPQRLYLARTAILYMLPVCGIAVVCGVRRARRPDRAFLTSVIAMLMGAQLVHHLALNRDWRMYRDRFVTELSVNRSEALVDYRAVSLPAFVQWTPRLNGFIWPWVMPYQSMFLRLPPGVDRKHLLYNPRSSYVHIGCGPMRRFALSPPKEILPELGAALADHVCRHNP
ncbi:hypothetical protein JXA88_17730 [Candidatus Fermentibacteria bacterium]|nr:hypothetical protein [Candidatus Fermentibacteria bacterium]